MSKDTPSETLPSYEDAVSSSAAATATASDDDVLPPTILVLSLQSIHAESDPSTALYRLSRGVARLGQATSEVAFERVERGGVGSKERYRPLYTLRHQRPVLQREPPDAAAYFIQAVSKHATRGHLGLRPAPAPAPAWFLHTRRRWTAQPVSLAGCTAIDMPPFVPGARPLFALQCHKGAYKWAEFGDGGGGKGRDVAMEYEADEQHRLIITASLHRQSMDALVALWCCRIWQSAVENSET